MEMMMTNLRSMSVLLLVAISFSGTTNATLVDRGGGLIYDTDLNVTWLADANYAATQYANTGGAQGDSDGFMRWQDAVNWVSTLSYYDSVRDQNLGGWRLPTVDPTCTADAFSSNYNCTAGELGHLFYNELGGTAGTSLLVSTDPDLALFSNISPDYYWLDQTVDNGANPPWRAWTFFIDSGSQESDDMLYYNSVWAVRSGDVGSVPLPAAFWLFNTGLLSLVGFAKRKRRKHQA